MTASQMPESLKVPEELAAIQQALDSGATSAWFTHPRDDNHWRENEELAHACHPDNLKAVLTHISALQAALKDRDAEIERLRAMLLQAKSDMRGFIENSLCAADPDRPFSDVRHEVKQHPSLKAIDDVLTGGCNA